MTNNKVEIRFTDGRIGCYSYGVPVAAFIPKGTKLPKPYNWQLKTTLEETTASGVWICTDARYSVPTTKHMNTWANPQSRIEVSDHLLRTLLLPVERAK